LNYIPQGGPQQVITGHFTLRYSGLGYFLSHRVKCPAGLNLPHLVNPDGAGARWGKFNTDKSVGLKSFVWWLKSARTRWQTRVG